jgi:hypothetical protein
MMLKSEIVPVASLPENIVSEVPNATIMKTSSTARGGFLALLGFALKERRKAQRVEPISCTTLPLRYGPSTS